MKTMTLILAILVALCMLAIPATAANEISMAREETSPIGSEPQGLNFFTQTPEPQEQRFHSIAGMVERVDVTTSGLMNPTTYTVRFMDGRFAIFAEKYVGTLRYKPDNGVSAIVPDEISFGTTVLAGHGWEFMINQDNELYGIYEARPAINGYGDITDDGVVTGADFSLLYAIMDIDSAYDPAGDVNGNGRYDFADIIQIYNYINYRSPCFSVNIPVVNAGTDKIVQSGQIIVLSDASAYERDGQALSFSWSSTHGALSNYYTISPTFYAPYVEENTKVSLTLIVTNNLGQSTSDNVDILVERSTGLG